MMEQNKDNYKMIGLSYYNIFNFSLPLVESNIYDVNQRERNNN